jgi:uncharacterized protein (TIGR00297 family)
MSGSSAPAPSVASGAVKRREGMRKSIHMLAGLLALSLRYLNGWQALAVCAVAFIFNWQILPRITSRSLERDQDRARGYAAGIIIYPLSVAALVLIFFNRLEIAAAAWGLMAFGDGAATLAGTFIGGPRLPWNKDKSWSGFLGFIAFGALASTFIYTWVAAGHPGTPITHIAPWILILGAATLGAFIESIPTGIDDNITVPLLTGGCLFGLTFLNPEIFASATPPILQQILVAAGVNLLVSGAAYMARTVQLSGAVVGHLIGTAIYAFGGWRAYVILIVFFVLASGSTKVGYKQKAARRIAQEAGGRRGSRHAIANCGLAAFLALLAAGTPFSVGMQIALTAALATAVFDTVSTEIGQVYGKHPILITNLRPVPPGTDGAVSIEGTLAGMAAGAVLAGLAWAMGTVPLAGAGVVIAAAFIGTTFESYLGATVEAVKVIDNEAVNFANTLVGALSALGIWHLIS